MASAAPAVPPPRRPSAWSQKDKCKHLTLDESLLRVSYKGSRKYENDAAAVRADCPIPPSAGIFYWEVHIVDKGRVGHIGIGLCAANTSLGRLPGWDEHSYGYHADDGFLFKGSGGESYGPTFTTGDTVGCCVNFRDNTVLYTRNGERLGVAFRGILTEPLYPTVGLRTPGEVVEANFGQRPFCFDIASLIEEEKRALMQTIRGSALPTVKSRLPAVVLQYLVQCGYSKTAAAFAKAIRAEKETTRAWAGIEERQKIGKLILAGDIQAAMEAVERYEGLLEKRPALVRKLRFHRFIQIVLNESPEAAIAYSRSHLRVEDCQSRSERDELEDVLSLLAYENPHESPVAHLLTTNHRESLASTVNSAILEHHGHPSSSTVEQLIAHTRVAVDHMVAENVPAASLAQVDALLSDAEADCLAALGGDGPSPMDIEM